MATFLGRSWFFSLQALHGGAKPSLAALDRLLACLREPRPQPGTARKATATPAQPSMFGVSTLCRSCTVAFLAADTLTHQRQTTQALLRVVPALTAACRCAWCRRPLQRRG